MTVPAFSGWTPVALEWAEGKPTVQWCLTDGIPFTDPFFDETVERCFRDPGRLLFQRTTGIDEVAGFATDHPGLEPAGFVFHMSRCGSTLVAQMLGQSPRHLVLSEARPIDGVLRAGWTTPGVTDEDRGTWLRWMVSAMGQRRDPAQERLFVKFDAWSVIDLAIVRRAFPDVPWLFLYRNPVEVLVSQSGRLGGHMVPGVLPASMLGMTAADVTSSPPADYQARVLARICRAALDHCDDPGATFVEYRQLPDFVVSDLPGIWSFPLEHSDVERMRRHASRDAKNPAIPFDDDRSRKQALASPALRAAAERWLAPLYDELEQARANAAQRPPALDLRR